jgi:hypothetical protein
MRTGRIAIVLACATALTGLCGCGGGRDESTPVACLEGSKAYLTALEAAPKEVVLGAEAPLGDCLAENQQAGDLSGVGEAMVEAATTLNAEARAEDGGQAAIELGYLLGAVEAAAAGTEGIHTELVRRLVVAARFTGDKQPLSPAFMRAYETGFAAGSEG